MKKRSIIITLCLVLAFAMFPMTASAASYKPGKVKIATCKAGSVDPSKNTATVTLKWNRVKNATGYQVFELNENNKWVRLKTLGKNYGGLYIYNDPAGQRSYRIRAIRKVKGKTYYGAYTRKNLFIKSPLTLEKYYQNVLKEDTETSDPIDMTDESIANGVTDGTFKTKITGNKVIMTYEFNGSADAGDYLKSLFTDVKKEMSKECKNLCKSARVGAGIKGVTVKLAVKLGGQELSSVVYNEKGIKK